MDSITVIAKRTLGLGALALGLLTQPANAVILLGSGDPAYNTTPPKGALANSGWQFQGYWGGFLGTPIAQHYFIAARHVGGAVGQTFTYQGVPYITTAYWNDPSSDFRIWKVAGTFPTYAPLYSLRDEGGKPFVVIGRGTQRGEVVATPVVQTNACPITLDLKALGIPKKLAQQEFPEATFQGHIMTLNSSITLDLKALGIPKKLAQREFPEATFHGRTMTLASTVVTTNFVPKGWRTGASDGKMRWGQCQVSRATSCIQGTFDKNGGPNQAYLSGGDSSGAVFMQENGVWKLAGINYGIDGPFGLTLGDSFYGAIFDESGLYVDGSLLPDDGQVRPASFYATRISVRLTWIQSIISQS